MKRNLYKKHKQPQSDKFPLVAKIAIGCVISSSIMLGTTQTASAFSISSFLSFVQQQFLGDRTKSALQILTKQDSIGANILAENKVNLDKTLATVDQKIETQSRLIDAIKNFMDEGALANSARCSETEARENDAISAVKTDLRTAAEVSDIANTAWYSMDEQQSDLTNARFDIACSLEMGKMGFCMPQPFGLQYHDVDFSYTMSGSRITQDQYTAARIGAVTLANNGNSSTQTTQDCSAEGSECALQFIRNSQRNAVGSLINYSIMSQLNNRLSNGSNVGG
jgi:hypothetical protein